MHREREREREREIVIVCVREWEKKNVCVFERERERHIKKKKKKVTLTKSGLKSLFDEAEGGGWRRRGELKDSRVVYTKLWRHWQWRWRQQQRRQNIRAGIAACGGPWLRLVAGEGLVGGGSLRGGGFLLFEKAIQGGLHSFPPLLRQQVLVVSHNLLSSAAYLVQTFRNPGPYFPCSPWSSEEACGTPGECRWSSPLSVAP